MIKISKGPFFVVPEKSLKVTEVLLRPSIVAFKGHSQKKQEEAISAAIFGVVAFCLQNDLHCDVYKLKDVVTQRKPYVVTAYAETKEGVRDMVNGLVDLDLPMPSEVALELGGTMGFMASFLGEKLQKVKKSSDVETDDISTPLVYKKMKMIDEAEICYVETITFEVLRPIDLDELNKRNHAVGKFVYLLDGSGEFPELGDKIVIREKLLKTEIPELAGFKTYELPHLADSGISVIKFSVEPFEVNAYSDMALALLFTKLCQQNLVITMPEDIGVNGGIVTGVRVHEDDEALQLQKEKFSSKYDENSAVTKNWIMLNGISLSYASEFDWFSKSDYLESGVAEKEDTVEVSAKFTPLPMPPNFKLLDLKLAIPENIKEYIEIGKEVRSRLLEEVNDVMIEDSVFDYHLPEDYFSNPKEIQVKLRDVNELNFLAASRDGEVVTGNFLMPITFSKSTLRRMVKMLMFEKSRNVGVSTNKEYAITFF